MKIEKREYTEKETFEFKRKRNKKTRRYSTRISITYPEGCTQQRRGFTPAGSALLNFDNMRQDSVKKTLKRNNRIKTENALRDAKRF